MKKSLTLAALLLSLSSSALAFDRPVTLEAQGSFAAGGITVTASGTYDRAHPTDPAGQTLHGDHAYVFWQRPIHAKKLPLVFLHGAGQSARTWETTPDGRDGFQNIFLEKGYAVYLIDQPRRGRAGRSTVPETLAAAPDDQLWFDNFRMGQFPDFYDGLQFSETPEALDQFFRQMTPNTGAYDEALIARAMAAVFEKSGDGILVTHSQGGGPGWRTVIESPRVKAVAAFEPGSGFVFPEGEAPEPMETTSPFGKLRPVEIPLADFEKLTRVPIIIYYGDYIPEEMSDNWGGDNWRVRLAMAREFADTINRHGGDATVIHLPGLGIRGNSHFLFAEKNNKEIADHFANWLHEKGLDK